MDLTGIENEAEFFPAGTLSEVLATELADITAQWSKLERAAHPVERIASSADRVLSLLSQLRNTADRTTRSELHQQIGGLVAQSLGYTVKRDAISSAHDDGGVISVINQTFDGDGRCQLWIIDTPVAGAGEEDADPLGIAFADEQFDGEVADDVNDMAIEELIAEGIFEQADAPRYLLIAGTSQWVLVDSRKWPARSVLRFNLQEIFSRQDKDTYRVMACLIAREARVPHTGAPLSDRLEEEAQRNANAVTSSLKKTVRDAIEILGQEVLDVTNGKFPSGDRRGVWIDGQTLSLECLRYMYRMLFLLYAESNPRLGILDIKDPVYASGYSMESLRELESVKLRSRKEKDDTYLWESLQQTLGFLYSGEPHCLKLPAVKVSLLDPESTPLLNSVKLRNEAVQKIIRLLSLRQSRKSTGRISYAKLGIGQLGAVYETLISFTGTVCKDDMIEIKGDAKDRAASAADEDDVDGSDAEVEADATDDDLEFDDDRADADARVDKVDVLAPTYFVPRRRIAEFNPDAVVFAGTQAKIYPKGSFTYRLAGRDREKTAAYYTPEPLARLLVKHLLMERCKDLSADELLDLKILEPAMGSAAFLVETTNQLADLYLERKQREVGRTIPQEDIVIEKQRVRSYIADRNCFGVDLNPTAVELGAISLWLNGLHKGDFSPWFGDQLHAGNSLIGARRAVYSPSQLKGKTADLWFNHPPTELGWKEERQEEAVFQWLLPAKDMAAFEKDKSIKSFAGEHQERIKKWRASGFFKPLEAHEISLVKRLSTAADVLFNIVADELARTRDAANDEITIWPEQLKAGVKDVDYHKKELLKQRLMGEDHAHNTLPFKRLKTAMDAWCALWLWPIEQADKLPSRQEFFEGMRVLLEGGFSADGSFSLGEIDDFAVPQDDLFGGGNEVRNTTAKYNTSLFQETNVEALVKEYDWLRVAGDVAEQARFVHFDLLFADISKERGGFDLIVGNPPWMQPKWTLSEVLGDVDPLLFGLSASSVFERIENQTVNKTVSQRVIASAASVRGAINFLGSKTNYPLSATATNNLYRNFVELSWALSSKSGFAGLIHQDGHLSSPIDDKLRDTWYRRVVKSFEFSNQITAKNFSEVLNTRRFSLNVYRGEVGQVNFEKMTNIFLASQVEDSYAHDGMGPVSGIRFNDTWDVRGHRDRIVLVNDGYLSALSKIMPDELKHNPTFLHPLHARQKRNIELLLSRKSIKESDVNLTFDLGPAEQDLLSSGLVSKEVHWPDVQGAFILTSPSIFVGDFALKTPRCNATNFKHYDLVEPFEFDPIYRPRTIFKAEKFDLVESRFYGRTDDLGCRHHNKFRFVYRKMVDSGASRTLVGTIVPPRYLHHSQLVSFSALDEVQLLSCAALLMTVTGDFLVRSLLTKNVYESTIRKLPYVEICEEGLNRVLILVSKNLDYKPFFDRNYSNSEGFAWALSFPAVRKLNNAYAEGLDERSIFLSPLERRLLEIELDVIVAQRLGLRLSDFESILDSFELMNKNEHSTLFDSRGNIVFSKASGFERIGYVDDRGNPVGLDDILQLENQYQDSVLTCEVYNDTGRQGPKVTRRSFYPPFNSYPRRDLVGQMWAIFSERSQKKVSGK